MDKLSHSPNAERKDTGLFARRKRPRRKRWLYVLRCRLVLMAALQAMNAGASMDTIAANYRNTMSSRDAQRSAPGGDRTEEVHVAQQVLQSLGIRSFLPQVTACPGCGRTTSTYFQELAQQIQLYVREQMPGWRKKFDGVEEMKLAVMGCIVNGPGESKHANIGISLPGTFEDPKAPVFIDGRLVTTLKGDHIVEEFKQILSQYVATRYAKKETAKV